MKFGILDHTARARPRGGHPHAHGGAALAQSQTFPAAVPKRSSSRRASSRRRGGRSARPWRASTSRKSSCAAIRASPMCCARSPASRVTNCGGSGKNTVGAHPRRRALPHAADDRRRQSARHQRAAGRPELRLAADDERSRARGGAARTAGLHLRCRRRRRRQRDDATRCRRFRRPARPRVRRLFDAQDRRRVCRAAATRGDYYVSASISRPTASTRKRPTRCCSTTTVPRTRRCTRSSVGTQADKLRLQFVARDIDAETAYDGCFSPTTFLTAHDCSATTEQTTYKVSAEHAIERILERVRLTAASTSCATTSPGARRPSPPKARSAVSNTRAATGFGCDGVRLRPRLPRREASSTTMASGAATKRATTSSIKARAEDILFVSLGARYDDNDDFGSHTSCALESRVRPGSRAGSAS